MKNKLSTIGRILFGLPFGIIGLNHFIMKDAFTGMLTSFIPGGGYIVILTGMALIAASLSIIFKNYIRFTCLLLAILLFLFIVTIHIPNLMHHNEKAIAMLNLLKDTSLLGGALMIVGLYKEDKKESKEELL